MFIYEISIMIFSGGTSIQKCSNCHKYVKFKVIYETFFVCLSKTPITLFVPMGCYWIVPLNCFSGGNDNA